MTDQNGQATGKTAADQTEAKENLEQEAPKPPTPEELQERMPKPSELPEYLNHKHEEVTAPQTIHMLGFVAAIMGVLTLAGVSAFIIFSMVK